MASFLTDQNEKRLTEATMDDAVRCQCLPEGDGKDHHATFYPDDVVDEVQLISLDSIKLEKETAQAAAAAPNAQEAALGEAYLADDRRISELMARGATRIAALGRAPELGRAKKEAKATTETEAKHTKVKVSRAKHGSGTEVKADSEPPSKARRGAASAKAGSAEKRQEKSRRRSSSVESSAVGLKQARANAKVRRFGGATPTKAAAATAVIGIFAALGVAATRLRRSTLRASEERQPLIPGR